MKEYFSHDYSARNDIKLKRLFMSYGLEGVGLYWCFVEMLYESGGRIASDMISVIAFDLRIDENKIISMIDDFGLFVRDGDFITSDSVLKRIDMRSEKSFKAKKSAENRWKNADNMRTQCERNANALEPHSDRIEGAMRTHDESKVNKSKVNKRKEKIYIDPPLGIFDNVFLTEDEFGKLKDKYPDCQDKINRLSTYIESSGKKYKSHYATILNWAAKDGTQKKIIDEDPEPDYTGLKPWEICELKGISY